MQGRKYKIQDEIATPAFNRLAMTERTVGVVFIDLILFFGGWSGLSLGWLVGQQFWRLRLVLEKKKNPCPFQYQYGRRWRCNKLILQIRIFGKFFLVCIKSLSLVIRILLSLLAILITSSSVIPEELSATYITSKSLT